MFAFYILVADSKYKNIFSAEYYLNNQIIAVFRHKSY